MFEKIKQKVDDIWWEKQKERYSISPKGKYFIAYCTKFLNEGSVDYIEAYENVLQKDIQKYGEEGYYDDNDCDDNDKKIVAIIRRIAMFLNFATEEEEKEILDSINEPEYKELVVMMKDTF